jgi:glycosyltransferase involved in cell wall biosynthesis
VLINAERGTIMRKLREARCLIMPIRWREPFGMVMIEAMSLGVPVVALGRGSVPEVVEHGVTGYVCDEIEELPAALGRVAELDPQDCVRRVRDHFSAQIMAERYEDAYRQAIAEFASASYRPRHPKRVNGSHNPTARGRAKPLISAR